MTNDRALRAAMTNDGLLCHWSLTLRSSEVISESESP
jgi:hypothetical protein